ncbi:MAG: SUMF1/EgtB/PvdO family nonheme iron enzyme [Planctomycetota bacterium]
MTDTHTPQPPDWRQVRALFERCVGLDSRQIDEILEKVDSAIAREVRDLLRHAPSTSTGASGGGNDDVGAMRFSPGERIGGYRILRVLGSGGIGVVLVAEQQTPRRLVALKILRADLPSTAATERFRMEAEVLARLRHPGIAQIYETGVHVTHLAGIELRRPWFAMELVENARTLRAFATDSSVDRERRITVLLDVCDAVQHGHLRGVVHRDLKPENILIGTGDRTKVIDFGVARILEGDDATRARLTMEGDFVGTLAYASPEQIAGKTDTIDTRSDVFALGVLGFELLTGALPFGELRGGLATLAERMRDAQARRARAVVRGFPTDLDAILGKALDTEPDRRYPTAGALADDIRRFLRSETVEARVPTAIYQLRKLAQRHRAVALVLLTAVAAAVAIAVISSVQAQRTQRALTERNEAATRATTHLKSLLRLSLQSELDDLVRMAEHDFWPVHSARIPAMDLWLTRADALVARLPELRAELDSIRRDGRPVEGDSRSKSAGELARARADLSRERERLRIINDVEKQQSEDRALDLRTRVWLVERREQRLATAAAIEQPYRIAADDELSTQERSWQHDGLAALVAGIEALAATEAPPEHILGIQSNTRQAVARRRELAESIARATVQDVAERWATARAAIAADPRFDGFDLPVQEGLLPIGTDPDSGLHEFAMPITGSVPTRDAAGRLLLGFDTAVVFVLLPPGRARVGTPAGHPDNTVNGKTDPIEEADLSAFLLSKYEFTQSQWLRLTEFNPSFHHVGGVLMQEPQHIRRSHPVTDLSHEALWDWLPKLGLELPTEVQWEYACRAGTTTRFYFGDELAGVERFANFRDKRGNAPGATWDDGHYSHARVGSFLPNAFGLHDVHGNVHEACSDSYYLPAVVPMRAGDGLRSAPTGFVDVWVYRGGSFWGGPVGSATRAKRARNESRLDYGFRPVWPIAP